jgi:tetratricopeptide (TPR) repeat protein
MNLETANSFYNLGFVYRGIGNHPEALRMFQKALHLRLQIFGPMHHYVASAYDEIGLEWMEQNENDSAIVYFQKALKVHTDKPGTKSFMRAYEYRHIGSAYVNKREYTIAMDYYKEALEINLKYYGKKHEQVSQSYSDIANIYLRESDFAKAVENTLLSISALIWSNSMAMSQLQTLNAPMLFSALEALGDIHFQKFEKQTHAPSDLREAFASYETAINLTDNIRRDYTLEESKLMLGQKMSGVTEKAIRSAIQLFKTTKDSSFIQAAFIFSERNKASVLFEVLKDQYAKSTSGIPDSIIQYESQLQARIGSLNKKLYLEQTAVSPANNKIRMLQDQIFNLTTEYERHIQYVERQYPHYFELKYKPITISLEEIQKTLPDSTALIEYFIGNQQSFVFYLDKNRLFCHTLVVDSTVFRNIVLLRSGMESQDFESYGRSASLLYRTFLAPLKISNILNLIIIPDGPLASVPFEVLLLKPAKTQEYSDLDYLIKTYTISYAYSSALSFQKNSSQENPRKNLVGFSPSFFK